MKKKLLAILFLFYFLFKSNYSFGATQTYYIPLSNLVNCASNCGAAGYYSCGGQIGFDWNDVIPAGNNITSVSIQFMIGVDCNGTWNSSFLNGAAESSFFSNSNGCSCSTISNGISTINATPGNYVRGGLNQFRITPGGASCLGFYPNWTGGTEFGVVTVNYTPVAIPYKATFTAMNTGSATWCAGETRNVTVTVTNSGTSAWTNSGPDVNIGVKWANWADYYVRVDANGLAPGASTTFTLPLTASNNNGSYTTPLPPGSNNIIFDVVKEGDCWFGNNNGSCGPGNSAYVSPAQTISCCTPGTPTGLSASSITQTQANISWAAGSPAGSPNVTYNWFVGTNPAGTCGSASVPFVYTGGLQTWVVPAGITSVTLETWGAQGGSYIGAAGLGGYASGILSVTPGQTLNIYVGGQGATNGTGGYNGGGSAFGFDGTSYGTGGGGASDVRVGGTALANRVIIGGGGGGGGYYSGGAAGGAGGGTTGGAGAAAVGFPGYTGGGGGTPAAGGAAGGSSSYAFAGSLGQGANQTGSSGGWCACAGGGGYYGGGSGGALGAGGGGGSSYTGGVTGGSTSPGVRAGNGAVTISYSSSPIAQGSTTSTSALATGLTCGTTYYLSVYATTSCNSTSSACVTSAAFTTNACCTAPSISVQPVSQTKCVGNSVTFSVTAAGTGLTYQWRKNGVNIGGATSSSYTIPSVVVGDAANMPGYSVVITGTCGTVTSSAATLTVDPVPVQGTVSNAGPIEFCSATGDWSAVPISVSGSTGVVWWQFGWSSGGWSGDWVSGTSPAYGTFPSKVSTSDGNADRIRWYVKSTNGACTATSPSTAILIKNHYNAAPTSLTSSAGIICLGSSVTLTATFASSIDILGTVEFSTSCGGAPFASVTAGNNVTAVTATVTPSAGGNMYYARYNPGTGTGCSPSTCVSVNVVANNAPALPAVNTSAQTICSNSVANVSGNNPAIGTGSWSVASGPNTSSTQFGNTANNNTTFTPAGGAGNYVVRWTISNLPCSSDFADATIAVVAAPTTATNTSTQTICTTGSATLSGNNPTSGTGAWSVVSGPSTASSQFGNTAVYNTTFTPAGGAGSYVVKWTITSSAPCATSSANATITVNAPPTTATNTSTQTQCSLSAVSLSGNNPTVGTGAWTVVSGPSTSSAQFGNTAVYNTSFTPAGGVGAYVVQWTISNSPCTASSATATLTFNATVNITAQPGNATICAGSTTALSVTATGGVLSYQWQEMANYCSVPTNVGTNSPNYTTPALSAGTYYYRCVVTNSCGSSTSSCATITVDAAPVQGSVSNAGPIDFCSVTGDWSADAISIAGSTGVVWWQYGASNGTWSGDWASGLQPAYTTFPKKVAVSDANPDRVRWYVKSANGACAATAYSSAILLRNHRNEDPTNITSTINNICAGTAGTLTVNFPTAICILGTVEIATSCAGAPIATITGNGTTSVSTAFTAPATTTTYYARYNPGTGTGCAPGNCVSVTVTVLPPAPATPGGIVGTPSQCPNITGETYSITPVPNATNYVWTVPAGWTITGGAGTATITVTTGAYGQNGNITLYVSNSCGTSATVTLPVTTNGCMPAPAQLVFPASGNYYATLSNGAYLVMGNSSTSAFLNVGTSGGNRWVISEGENNYIQWNSIPSGTYILPFGYSSTDYIPFTFEKTSAGTSNLIMSTWATPSNNQISGVWCGATNVGAVTNMYDATVAGDGSIPAVIDRWWKINTTATANLTFSYRGAENTTTYSPLGAFGAQHWNGTSWDAIVGNGTGVTSGIGTVTVSAASTFSPWVLVSKTAPLPVQWLGLSAECYQNKVTVKWSTATEQNASHFTVERSIDGATFFPIATLQASGNSSTPRNYSFTDPDPLPGISFYQIRETDYNGNFMTSDVLIVNECSGENVIIYGDGIGVTVNINADEDGAYVIEIFDLLGRSLMSEAKNVSAGVTQFKLTPIDISSDIYIVKVHSKNHTVTKKVFIR